MRHIRGKRALVTGAASGIGQAIALALAKQGADVCLVDIDEPGLNAAAAEVEALGVRVLAIRCDVSEKTDIAAAVERLLGQWGGLEVLVNNAGVVHYGPTEQMSEELWDHVLGVNLLAAIHFTRLLLPSLLRQKE